MCDRMSGLQQRMDGQVSRWHLGLKCPPNRGHSTSLDQCRKAMQALEHQHGHSSVRIQSPDAHPTRSVSPRNPSIPCYHAKVIVSFASEGTYDIFHGKRSKAARKTCPQM